MALQVQPFVFDCPPCGGSPWPTLKITAKRYRASVSPPVDGLTLIFFHCNGAHKEQWEPVITYIFSQSRSFGGRSRFKIREVWAFDSPTHGDAAVMNREILEERMDKVCTIYDWVPGVVEFLRSDHMRGHRVVICGHSATAAVVVLAVAEFFCTDFTSVDIAGLVLIESEIMTLEIFERDFKAKLPRLMAAISARRDKWDSREDAALYFQNQFPWSNWDPEVLRIYIEHGLYELDDGTVTLKCDRKREADVYIDVAPHITSLVCLGKLCRGIPPVHAVWGARRDGYIPESIKIALSDASQGRKMASVTRVEGAGHMIVQEQPIGIARAICNILETTRSAFIYESKL